MCYEKILPSPIAVSTVEEKRPLKPGEFEFAADGVSPVRGELRVSAAAFDKQLRSALEHQARETAEGS